MRKVLIAIAAAAAILYGAVWIVARPALGRDPSPVVLKVPKGASSRQVIGLLAENGVVHSPGFFRALHKIVPGPSSFRHGTYRLERNRYWKTLRQLRKGQTYRIKVTLPEGWTAYQMAQRLVENNIIADAESFHQHVKRNALEGFLFPETYFFEVQSDADAVASQMKAQFDRKFTDEMRARAAALKMTERQVATLASIIEREARRPDERAVISSVYHNRLKIGRPLEADPTVQYALSDGKFWKERLIYRDLDVKSPYNTYRVRGLPPGPICNPGIESVRAALYPAETRFLYFVADPDGSGVHYFSEQFSEHQSKVAAMRRKRRAAMSRRQVPPSRP